MVYARTHGDATLTFIVSGKLWRNSMIMQDEETGTLWSHVTGEALDGALAGARLEMIPSVQTTWSEWVAAHPDTRVLRKSEEIRASRYEAYFTDEERVGLFNAEWLQGRLPAKALVHGIVDGPHALAVADAALGDDDLMVDLGGASVRVRRDAGGGVRAFETEGGAELVVRTAFWFAWSGFYPRTQVVD